MRIRRSVKISGDCCYEQEAWHCQTCAHNAQKMDTWERPSAGVAWACSAASSAAVRYSSRSAAETGMGGGRAVAARVISGGSERESRWIAREVVTTALYRVPHGSLQRSGRIKGIDVRRLLECRRRAAVCVTEVLATRLLPGRGSRSSRNER